ncbi:MAG: hypothetical protein ORN57_05590, partial [Alphaproteobacteria bacterium]|nr:hypothetical protein [Alphaproteobacteria bacterium]
MTAIVYKSIVFLPLLSAVLLLLAGRRMGEKLSAWVAAAFLFVPVVFSWIVFFLHKPLAAITNGEEVTALLRDGNGLKQHIFPLSDWLSLTSLHFSWNLLFDSLTLVMLLVVTSVSFLVHVYSKDYMHGDKNFSRFLAYLGFFTFAMLMLVS